jgi:hypothetical protein
MASPSLAKRTPPARRPPCFGLNSNRTSFSSSKFWRIAGYQLTYLKLSGKRLGLLINFNVVHLKDGITRMVNNS